MFCAGLFADVARQVDALCYRVGRLQSWAGHRGHYGFQGGVIAASGAVDTALAAIVHNGIPLPLLTAAAALAVSYAIGVHLAATGLLVPIFILLFPASALGPPMVSLLFRVSSLAICFRLCISA